MTKAQDILGLVEGSFDEKPEDKAKRIIQDYIKQLQKHEKTLRGEFSITMDELKKFIEKLGTLDNLSKISDFTGPIYDATNDTVFSVKQLHKLILELDEEG